MGATSLTLPAMRAGGPPMALVGGTSRSRAPVQRTFAIATFGCKVNQCDSQLIREHLTRSGWREAAVGERPQLYVVNTCAVTAFAVKKCRQAVRRALRTSGATHVIVTGCAAISEPERFSAMRGVTAVLTRDEISKGALSGFASVPASRDRSADLGSFPTGISGFSRRTRAFLRIQDGCNAACAYCIVPLVRGPERSRPLSEIRSEAERLVAAGHVEIVLTGIHMGRYGAGLHDRPTLVDAVRCVLGVPGLQRLRLSSIEAVEVSDDLLDVMASDERVCPHLHLPLQSGDDGLLAMMNRSYTVADFLDRVRRAKERLVRPAITTDVIVGFPGETEAAFANTLAACREAGFSRIHIFPFSPRPGTRAAEMPGRVAPGVVRERVRQLKRLAALLARTYADGFVGEVVFPLAEHRGVSDTADGSARVALVGWSERYVRTEFTGPAHFAGRIVPVRVTASVSGRLIGTIVSDMLADRRQSSVSATS